MKSRPRSLTVSLFVVEAIALCLLVRCAMAGVWITVIATLALIVGAQAALRGRTWGVGFLLATAISFPCAAVMGMAPNWFWLFGLAGALPFALTVRRMAQFDARATALLAVLATATGIACALAWHETAPLFFALLHRDGW